MAEGMSREMAIGWLAFAAGKRPHADIIGLGLTDDQLQTLAGWLAANPMISVYARPKPQKKRGVFLCLCGCGERFETTYTTTKPSYKNHAHRQRAYDWRRKAALAQTGKEWIPDFEG